MKTFYKLLILGFFLLNIYQWLGYADVKYGVPTVIKYIISFYVIGIIIFYKFNNPLKPLPGGLFSLFIITFVIMSIILVINALTRINSLFYLQMIFGKRYIFLPYLIPVFLLLSKFDLDFFSYFFHYSSVLIIPALFIQIYIALFTISPSPENYIDQENFIHVFDIGSGLLLLTAHISRKKYVSYAVILYYLLWIVMYSVYGRRGELLNVIVFVIFMFIIRLKSSFLKITDRMKIYFAGSVLILLLISFGYLFMSTFVFQRGFNKDAFDASRGEISKAFFSDFRTTSDWIFGRGINGTVLRSLIVGGRADFFENGFLTIILK